MNVEQVKQLKHGDVLHYQYGCNADRTCARFKVISRVKTWKRNPGRVQVSLKRGLWEYAKIRETNCRLFITEEECGCHLDIVEDRYEGLQFANE